MTESDPVARVRAFYDDHADVFGRVYGDVIQALRTANVTLRPGGRLYIEDLFAKEPVLERHRAPICENIRRINGAYCHDVADLYDALRHIRSLGFILAAMQIVDIPLEENLDNLQVPGVPAHEL